MSSSAIYMQDISDSPDHQVKFFFAVTVATKLHSLPG